MKKIILTLIGLIVACVNVFSESNPIAQSNYKIHNVSNSQSPNWASNAIDGDTTTYWALGGNPKIPAYVEIDLGKNYDIDGFSILPETTSNNNKPLNYKFYLSTNGTDWGSLVKFGLMRWNSNDDLGKKEFFFKAITARYAKIVFEDGTPLNNNIHTSEIVIYESTKAATGQANQFITFGIPDKYTIKDTFTLTAVASSGLPITYNVVSGPASVANGVVTLTGTGKVKIQAKQAGNTDYYSISTTRSFKVWELSDYEPVVTTRLTDNFPIEMPSLMAYPIYMNGTIEYPNLLSIVSMTVEIDGLSYEAQFHNSGYFYFLWTPSSYGSHTIDITAYSSNGNSSEKLTRKVTVTNTTSTQNVTTLDSINITLGGTNSRKYYGTYSMPQHVGAYNNIIANLTIECPATAFGCDRWDRLAYIDIKAPNGNWIQIIRYITPYGVACNHSIALTDYASLLQGEFEFRVFIDTWGDGGWLVSLDFDFDKGSPKYNYSMVDEIWDAAYDFGTPKNKQPVEKID